MAMVGADEDEGWDCERRERDRARGNGGEGKARVLGGGHDPTVEIILMILSILIYKIIDF